MLMQGIATFFGLIAFALLILLCIYVLAKKYLRGDFFPNETAEEYYGDDSDIDQTKYPITEEQRKEEEKAAIYKKYGREVKQRPAGEPSAIDKLSKAASSYHEYAQTEAVSLIKQQIGGFITKATLSFSLEYIQEQKCILGVIHSLNGLSTDDEDAPSTISLHLKLLPKVRFRNKTKYRLVNDQSSMFFQMTFTFAPILLTETSTEKFNIRLYGKKAGFLKAEKCYGECYVMLQELLHSKGYKKDYKRNILPKASSSNLDAKLPFSSDSETDR